MLEAVNRPRDVVLAGRPRGLELVVLDQQPGQFALHRDQAIGAGVEIGRERGDAHAGDIAGAGLSCHLNCGFICG